MANLFELAAKLTLDSSDYEKGIEAAKQAAANFSKGLSVVVTAVTTTDRAVNNAADSAENLGTETSNAADGVNMLNQAEAQTTQAANAMARAEENAADSAENLSQSAENASESISETEELLYICLLYLFASFAVSFILVAGVIERGKTAVYGVIAFSLFYVILATVRCVYHYATAKKENAKKDYQSLYTPKNLD